MKDLPVFTTENGVASLTLREVNATGSAYIRLQASQSPERLLEECISFCRMVGALHIYASGDAVLDRYPLHTALWEMACHKESVGETDAALWPVQENTLAEFRRLYNEKIVGIPNCAWMSETEAERMLAAGEGYFIHRADVLLGIGMVSEDKILFVASFVPGAGQDIIRALVHGILDERITLEVASENWKAIALYERMGFIKVREISRWYRVFDETD